MPIFVGRYVPINSDAVSTNGSPKLPPKPEPETGSPMGLLLALTYTR